MKSILLKPGRDHSVRHHHPWVFSGAVAQLQGKPEPGETVAVRAPQGEFLAYAAYSPASKIAARIWTWDEGETVDADFIRRRLEAALALRRALIPAQETDALRLVHAESDGLPGLVVDRYADRLVVQFLSPGVERWRETILGLLAELTGAASIYERSDVEARTLEALPEREGLLHGAEAGPVLIRENGLPFLVDPAHGQKTGFYLDQRRNRQRLRELSAGRDVLNCFCYTGAFSVYALAGGARSVLSIDTSVEALAVGRENVARSGLLDDRPVEWLAADVFQALRAFRDEGRTYDLIVLDPPKFAATAAQAERAARGYKDINLLAFKLLRPGGLLFTFSCSAGISADLFQKIVAGAALDAGVHAEIVQQMTQGPDHPVALNFPEGAYLKGLICWVR